MLPIPRASAVLKRSPQSELFPRSSHPTVWALAVALALAAALVLTQINVIRLLGLHYDEVLFVNAATEGFLNPDNSLFVRRRLFGIPVLLMDYIGALKAWIYVPIFSVFGVNVWSIRLPMLMATITSLFLATRVIGESPRTWRGVLLILVLVVDPVFWISSTADTGPIAIAAFLRVLSITMVINVVRSGQTPRNGWFTLLAISISVGVFNKLDFAFFSIPFIAISAFLFAPRWKEIWPQRKADALVALATLVAGHALFAYYMLLPSQVSRPQTDVTGLDRIRRRVDLLDATFDGRFTMDLIGGAGERPQFLLTFEILTVGLLMSIGISLRVRLGRRANAMSLKGPSLAGNLEYLTWLTVGILAVQLLTSGVQAPWHILHLWPLPQAILVTLVLSRTPLLQFGPWVIRTAALALCAAAVLVSLTTSRDVWSLVQDPARRTVIWSDDVKTLASELGALADQTGRPIAAVTADWGIGTQLQALTLDSGDVYVKDFWPQFPDGDLIKIRDVLNYHTPDQATQVVLVRHRAEAVLVVRNSVEVTQQLIEACGQLDDSAPIYAGRHIEAFLTNC